MFYGISIKEADTSKLSPFIAKHALPIVAYYYVTELCDMSLEDATLGVGNAERSELWEILAQVAAGCSYLHKKCVIHRDLKPGR